MQLRCRLGVTSGLRFPREGGARLVRQAECLDHPTDQGPGTRRSSPTPVERRTRISSSTCSRRAAKEACPISDPISLDMAFPNGGITPGRPLSRSPLWTWTRPSSSWFSTIWRRTAELPTESECAPRRDSLVRCRVGGSRTLGARPGGASVGRVSRCSARPVGSRTVRVHDPRAPGCSFRSTHSDSAVRGAWAWISPESRGRYVVFLPAGARLATVLGRERRPAGLMPGGWCNLCTGAGRALRAAVGGETVERQWGCANPALSS